MEGADLGAFFAPSRRPPPWGLAKLQASKLAKLFLSRSLVLTLLNIFERLTDEVLYVP